MNTSETRVESFRPGFQSGFRQLVLDGLAEHWGEVDDSLNRDLEDIASFYRDDIVLVAIGGETLVGTGVLLLRPPSGEIVRMSVHRDHRRQGVGTALVTALIEGARDHGIDQVMVETNAAWAEARSFYERSGFTFTHHAPGVFGLEAFYEIRL